MCWGLFGPSSTAQNFTNFLPAALGVINQTPPKNKKNKPVGEPDSAWVPSSANAAKHIQHNTSKLYPRIFHVPSPQNL